MSELDTGGGWITGRRTSLRPIEPDDAEVLRRLMNEPVVTGSFVETGPPVSVDQERRWASALEWPKDGPWYFTIVETAKGEVVGLASFPSIDWRSGTARVATKLIPEAHGRGLAYDAAMVRTAWAFLVLGLRRLESTVIDFNGGSLRLHRRIGYRFEGRRRQVVQRGGRWCDLLLYGLLRDEFAEHPEWEAYRQLVLPMGTDPIDPEA